MHKSSEGFFPSKHSGNVCCRCSLQYQQLFFSLKKKIKKNKKGKSHVQSYSDDPVLFKLTQQVFCEGVTALIPEKRVGNCPTDLKTKMTQTGILIVDPKHLDCPLLLSCSTGK